METFAEYLTGTYSGEDLDEKVGEQYSFLKPPEWFEHSTDGRGIKNYQAVLVRDGAKYRVLANARPEGDGTHRLIVGAQGPDVTQVLRILLKFTGPLNLTDKNLASETEQKTLSMRTSLMP